MRCDTCVRSGVRCQKWLCATARTRYDIWQVRHDITNGTMCRDVTGVWLVCDWCVTGVWQVCDRCVTGVWQVCDRCVAGVWQVCGRCVTGVWRCVTDVWQLCDSCVTAAPRCYMWQVWWDVTNVTSGTRWNKCDEMSRDLMRCDEVWWDKMWQE